MDEIYVKEFTVHRNTVYDNYIDTRNKALNEVNHFFNIHTCYKVLNIIEEWNEKKTVFSLIVYYY